MSVGKLALKTLLSGDPLLQRSVVIEEVGPDAFDYGLLIGHEEAHRLIKDETADIYVTFPHRSIQEFLGALYLIWILNRDEGEIQFLLCGNRDKPICLTNPLFLRFCLWFLRDEQSYFSFENKEKVYQCLVRYCVELMNHPVFDLNTIPAFASTDLALDKLRLKFLADSLLNCTKTSTLVLPSSETLDLILALIHPVLKAITRIKIAKGTYSIHSYQGTEVSLLAFHGATNELDIILKHYTKSMNEPVVHLCLVEVKYVTKKISYPNVKTLYLSELARQEIIEKNTKLNPNLIRIFLKGISSQTVMKREMDQLAKAHNLLSLSHLSLLSCEHLEGKLPSCLNQHGQT